NPESPSAARPASSTFVVCFRGHVVILTFGFFGMSQDGARTIERLRFGQGQIDNRIDEFEEFAIGRLLVKSVGLVANSIALAVVPPMVVVVEHFFKWTAGNHGLIGLETF